MGSIAFVIIVFLITYIVIAGAYQIIYDDNLTFEIARGIHKLMSKADIYDVDSVNFSNSTFYVVINEDGIKVPVRCPSDVYATLEGMFNLNKEDVKIKIKAKIDRKDLSLDNVQGYLIK